MTLTIDFSPHEEARLADVARQEGLEPAAFVKKLVTEHLSVPESDPTLGLFDQWAQEDAQMTPEEIENERRLWERFETNVNGTRTALGMERL